MPNSVILGQTVRNLQKNFDPSRPAF